MASTESGESDGSSMTQILAAWYNRLVCANRWNCWHGKGKRGTQPAEQNPLAMPDHHTKRVGRDKTSDRYADNPV